MNLKEKAYQTIRSRIEEGIYEPGEMLNEREIICELQISRTPFRDAINMLERDGLIEIRPNHGFYVFELSTKDIMDIFDVRFLLEPSVSELAAYRITQDALDDLREGTIRALNGTVDDMLREDDRFHLSVLHQVENAYLIKTMENIYTYFRMSNPRINRQNNAMPSLKEHLKILDALEAHDPKRAADVTREHLIGSRKRNVGLLF